MRSWVRILVGLSLGVLLGLFFGSGLSFLKVVGSIFIDLLKMIVGIIVFTSLVTGVCHISDPRKLGRIGLRTMAFYIISTLVAILVGIVLAVLMSPGKALQFPLPSVYTGGSLLSIGDFVCSLVPSNIFSPFVEGNILQIIVIAMLFAVAVNMSGNSGKIILNCIESISDIMVEVSHIVMKFAPFGVCALMATAVGEMGTRIILPLFMAVAVIFLSCMFQVFVVFTVAIKYLTGLSVAPFFKGMKDAIVVAVTTSSSSATLPVSLECAKDHLGISSDISGFVLSLGSTVNMNGTAIGQAVISIFIAQAYGIELSLIQMGVLICTSLISAIGTAGMPGGGLVMLSMVLSSVGLPLEAIAFVAAIDRFRDICATLVNILGDAVAALYVAKSENQIDGTKYHAATWME